MNKRPIIKLVGYGVLLWISLNIVLFVISLLFGVAEGAEMDVPPPLGFVIVAVVMVFVSYAFGRWYKPSSRKQAGIAGLVWSGMTIALMLAITIANDTQAVIFGNWGVYLALIAPAIGPMFVSVKRTDAGNPSPTA